MYIVTYTVQIEKYIGITQKISGSFEFEVLKDENESFTWPTDDRESIINQDLAQEEI